MLKKFLTASLLFAVLMGASQTSKAQGGAYYNNALGIRAEFGSGSGLFGFSGKHMFTNHHAGEAMLLFGSGITMVGFEYQYHAPIGNAEGLQWYAGFGASIGFGGGSTAFWVRPIGGLDYKISGAPINFSFDWGPTILVSNAYGGDRFTAGRFGFAARYAF